MTSSPPGATAGSLTGTRLTDAPQSLAIYLLPCGQHCHGGPCYHSDGIRSQAPGSQKDTRISTPQMPTDNEDQATMPPMPLSSKCSSYQSRCTVFIVVLSVTELLLSLGVIWSSRKRRLRCRRPSKTSYYSTGPLRLHSHRISRVPVEPAFAIRIVGRRAAREKPEKSPEF